MNDNFRLVQESLEYSSFVKTTDFYLDFEDYQICKESGLLEYLLQDQTLLTEQAKATDKYRELEGTGKKWLKYGLGGVLSPGAAGIYQGVKHKDWKIAAAGIGAEVGRDAAAVFSGGLSMAIGPLYMWWQRKRTDVCRNKCSGNKNECYYKCYLKAVNDLLKLANRDLGQAKKAGNKKMVKKVQDQISFYTEKRRKFEMKLKQLQR